MPFYLLVYYSGGAPLRPDQVEDNRQAWRAWNSQLNETYGIRTSKAVVVEGDSVIEYVGRLKGASIIEAASLEQAVATAQHSPSITYGGRVEVFEEF